MHHRDEAYNVAFKICSAAETFSPLLFSACRAYCMPDRGASANCPLPSRGQLTGWMEANFTGVERLRAKLPAGWRAADKTGSNGEHTSNDIAVFWPGGKPPVIVTAYITQCTGPERKRAAMLAEIGELARQPSL